MKTELFIKEINNETLPFSNPNFMKGLTGWTILLGGSDIRVDYGVYYPSDSVGSTILKSEDILSGTEIGLYKCEMTITKPFDGSGLTGSVTFEINDVSETFTEVGNYVFYLTSTDDTNSYISLNSIINFNGGITNIKVEGMSGDWKQIELYEDAVIPITYNINDISDVSTKNSSYSKTISIPGSKINNINFRNAFNINEDNSFILNKPVPCYITVDGLEEFNGFFELQRVLKNVNYSDYEGIIYSDLTNIFVKLGDRTLTGNQNTTENIDFSEYDHLYTLENIAASWATPYNAGQGYFYAPIDKTGRQNPTINNELGITNKFKVDEIHPTIFIKEIFDKMLRSVGYTYNSTFLNSNEFKKMVYPFTDQHMLMEDLDAKRSNASLNRDDRDLQCEVQVEPSMDLRTSSSDLSYRDDIEDIDWEIISQGSFTPYILDTFTCKIAGNYTIDINYNYEVNIYGHYVGLPGTWNLYTTGNNIETRASVENRIMKNGILISTEQIDRYIAPETIPMVYVSGFWGNNETPIMSNSYIQNKVIYLNIGDVITHEVRLWLPFTYQSWPAGNWDGTNGVWYWRVEDIEGGAITTRLQLTSLSNSTLTIERDNIITENNMVPMNQILHKDVKQTDFLNSIIKKFNLYIESDSNNVLTIEPRDAYYALSVPTDWSDKDKMDTRDIVIEKPNDLIEKVFEMKYTYDATSLEADYQKKAFKDYGEYLKINKQNKDKNDITLIETIFAPAPSHPLFGTSMVVPVMYKNVGGNSGAGTTIDLKADLAPRILYYGGLKNTQSNTVKFTIQGVEDPTEFTYPTQNNGYCWPYIGHFSSPYTHDASTTDLMFAKCDFYYNDYLSGTVSNNNLYNVYYSQMIGELLDDSAKLVTMNLNLTEVDIANFSFKNLIFIDDTYFRVNKIIDFVPGQLTRCELLTVKSGLFDFDEPISNFSSGLNVINDINYDYQGYTNVNVIKNIEDKIFYTDVNEANERIAKYSDVDTTNIDSTIITFSDKLYYNSPETPITSNIITDDLTDAKLGIIQKIYYSGSIPSFPTNWILTENTYLENKLNIIYAEYCGNGRVEYWYKHQDIFDYGFIMKVTGSTFTIPTNGTGYNYNVNVLESDQFFYNQTGDCAITFPGSGTYTIRIVGDFPQIYIAYNTDRLKVDSIEQWGNIRWGSMLRAFRGCENMVGSFTDVPDLSNVTDLIGMFDTCLSFNSDISSWDTSNITNMYKMFFGCVLFNQNIGFWDISNVTNLSGMFMTANIFDQNLSYWNTSNVTDMSLLFANSGFNGDISTWDTSNVINMTDMFNGCATFNRDISVWDTSSLMLTVSMFNDCDTFNQDISGWDTSNVIDMGGMFQNAIAFNQDLSTWCVSLIGSEPTDFDTGATAWVLNRPVWGTCP